MCFRVRGFEIDKKLNILVPVDVSCDVKSLSQLIFRVCLIFGRILVKTLFSDLVNFTYNGHLENILKK